MQVTEEQIDGMTIRGLVDGVVKSVLCPQCQVLVGLTVTGALKMHSRNGRRCVESGTDGEHAVTRLMSALRHDKLKRGQVANGGHVSVGMRVDFRVDSAAWASEFGLDLSEVPSDLRNYLRSHVELALKDALGSLRSVGGTVSLR